MTSHVRLAITQDGQGNLSGSLSAYRESLAIRERLATSDPTNVMWQRDLSVSKEKVGDVLVAAGESSGVLVAFPSILCTITSLSPPETTFSPVISPCAFECQSRLPWR